MPVAVTPEMCIAGRDLTEPKLDPSGRLLAFVARGASGAAISILDLTDDAGLERQLSTWPAPSPGRGTYGGCFDWQPDGTAIIYAANDGGLWRQPVPGGTAEQLTTADLERPVAAPAVAPDGSFVVYVVDLAEVWLQLLDGSAGRRLDDGEHDFCADPAVDPGSALVTYQAWSVPDMPWDGAEAVTVAADGSSRTSFRPDGAAVQQPRFAPDGTPLRVHDGTGWLQVWWGDHPLVAGAEATEHADASWGQGQVSYATSPDGRRVAFTRNERGFGRLCVASVNDGAVTPIAKGWHGQLSWRADRMAALRSGARTPTQVVIYDTDTWERRAVAIGPVAGWDAVNLVEPEPVEIDLDGTVLHARRYCSPRIDGDRCLLVMIHGGPTGQWPVTFMPRLAYWVDRGWDVLVPDHRGSTGYGRAYQQALNGRWGDLDVVETVAWIDHAHASGWSEPARTVVMGGSSGGFTVLGVLGRNSGRVAGGIALYPVTDLADLAARSHRFEAHSTERLVGPLSDTELYASRSAASLVGRIVDPLLVLHGTADPAVPVEGTIAFVEAMRATGRADVELHLFEGEGHGFRQPENQLAEYRLIEEFMARVVPPGSSGAAIAGGSDSGGQR